MLQNTTLFVPTLIVIIFFQWQPKLYAPVGSLLHHFYLSFYILCGFRPEYSSNTTQWMLSSNQSINTCIVLLYSDLPVCFVIRAHFVVA